MQDMLPQERAPLCSAVDHSRFDDRSLTVAVQNRWFGARVKHDAIVFCVPVAANPYRGSESDSEPRL